jgi:hypothetical protein
MSWLKRRLPNKRWKRAMIYVLSVLLFLLACDMLLVQYWRHIDVGPDTTRITAPLNAYGTPNYLAFLNETYSAGVTPENNAAPLLIEAVGTEKYNAAWMKKVLPQLGLPTAGLPAKVVGFATWAGKQPAAATQNGAVAADFDMQAEEMRARPWKAAEHPQWARWLDAQADGIQLVIGASDRPRCFFPLVVDGADDAPGAGIGALLPHLGGMRVLANALASDAMRAAGAGDIARFEADTAACLKLGRLIAQGPTLIELLVGISIQNNAFRAIDATATTPGVLSVAQCAALVADIDASGTLPGADRSIDISERSMFLDECCALAVFGLDRLGDVTGEKSPGSWNLIGLVYPVHYNQAMREANGYYDRIVAGLRLPTYSQRHLALKATENELLGCASEGSASKILQPARMLVGMLVPALVRVAELHQTSIANRQLARVALAMAAYDAEKGSYPESLKDLAGGILKEIPTDPFSDAALIYRRKDAGYILYSVGPDGKDDGGIDRKAAKDNHYDIVVSAQP